MACQFTNLCVVIFYFWFTGVSMIKNWALSFMKLVTRPYVLLFGLYPYLQKVDIAITNIIFLVHDTGACTHYLHPIYLHFSFITQVVNMVPTAAKHDGKNFHIDMRMNTKTFTSLHKIVIKRYQGTKGRCGRIIVITKAKVEITLQPANVFNGAFTGRKKFCLHILVFNFLKHPSCRFHNP